MTYDSFDDVSPIHLDNFAAIMFDAAASVDGTADDFCFLGGIGAYIAFLRGERDDSAPGLTGASRLAWQSGWDLAECEARDYLDALAEEVA